MKIDSTPHGEDLLIKVHGDVGATGVSDFTFDAYSTAIQQARAEGYKHLVRAWNRIPRINEFVQGVELYQHFCAGRFRAFSAASFSPADFPAASAVGSLDQSLSFSLLFSREPARGISNPRQIEAFNYPKIYGPTPPSFARGAVHRHSLYLSGTASIRGHQSLCPDDLSGQMDITLENMQAVIDQANLQCGTRFGLDDMELCIFVRDLRESSLILRRLEPLRNPRAKSMLLHADICRRELRVEIEGVAHDV